MQATISNAAVTAGGYNSDDDEMLLECLQETFMIAYGPEGLQQQIDPVRCCQALCKLLHRPVSDCSVLTLPNTCCPVVSRCTPHALPACTWSAEHADVAQVVVLRREYMQLPIGPNMPAKARAKEKHRLATDAQYRQELSHMFAVKMLKGYKKETFDQSLVKRAVAKMPVRCCRCLSCRPPQHLPRQKWPLRLLVVLVWLLPCRLLLCT